MEAADRAELEHLASLASRPAVRELLFNVAFGHTGKDDETEDTAREPENTARGRSVRLPNVVEAAGDSDDDTDVPLRPKRPRTRARGHRQSMHNFARQSVKRFAASKRVRRQSVAADKFEAGTLGSFLAALLNGSSVTELEVEEFVDQMRQMSTQNGFIMKQHFAAAVGQEIMACPEVVKIVERLEVSEQLE